jgi:hypothetical protein
MRQSVRSSKFNLRSFGFGYERLALANRQRPLIVPFEGTHPTVPVSTPFFRIGGLQGEAQE